MRLLNSVPFLIAIIVIIALYFTLKPSITNNGDISHLKLELIASPADYQAESMEFSKLHGKYYIIHVFASWCGACKQDLLFLQKIRSRTMKHVVGVAVRDNINKLRLLNKDKLPYDYIAFDSNNELAKIISSRLIPETLVINPEGKIIFRHIGGLNNKIAEDIALLINTNN